MARRHTRPPMEQIQRWKKPFFWEHREQHVTEIQGWKIWTGEHLCYYCAEHTTWGCLYIMNHKFYLYIHFLSSKHVCNLFVRGLCKKSGHIMDKGWYQNQNDLGRILLFSQMTVRGILVPYQRMEPLKVQSPGVLGFSWRIMSQVFLDGIMPERMADRDSPTWGNSLWLSEWSCKLKEKCYTETAHQFFFPT